MRRALRLAALTPSAVDLSSGLRGGGRGRHVESSRSLRQLHSSSHRASGSILNLGGLSVSRESRFLSKERGIPRTEFSPHLELIRSSEVDPFMGEDKPTGSPQAAAYPSLTLHIKEGLQGVSYLSKELQSAKEDRAKVEAALRDLQFKYKSREKEAALLALVTPVLIVGLLFSQKLGDFLDPALQQFRTVQRESSSAWHNIFSRLYSSLPGIQPPKRAGMKDAEDNAIRIAVHVPRPQFAWSQLFWASPG